MSHNENDSPEDDYIDKSGSTRDGGDGLNYAPGNDRNYYGTGNISFFNWDRIMCRRAPIEGALPIPILGEF